MPTAAAIIIGDEILSGKFEDENGPWLVHRCRELGIDLKRISIISDDVTTIGDEVRRASAAYDYVFTTGGIGPTHDDLTLESIAYAFSVKLFEHPELARLIRGRLGDATNSDALRMAMVPEGSELWQTEPKRFPVLVCRNVFIFPGVPKYLQAKFNDIAHRLGGEPKASRRLVTEQTESEIAATLRQAAETWPVISIGSYPRFETDPHTVIITMDGRSKGALDECAAWLEAHLKARQS